ncbi:MAG TPA: hypothetical protein DCZ92_03085 [Elusimicrobia bacterium]|nr:hypothetical protein [Elusimicrobiota bacterium]
MYIKTILKVAAVFIGCFIAGGLLLPAEFELSRSIAIAAHPVKVHLQVGELTQWQAWWPWDRKRGTKTLTPGPITSGPGATLSWTGKPRPGEVVLIKTSPTEGLEYEVLLAGNAKPYKGKFIYHATEQGTVLELVVSGRFETPITGPYLATLCDSMHGGMLDWGLENIKELVESDKREIFF